MSISNVLPTDVFNFKEIKNYDNFIEKINMLHEYMKDYMLDYETKLNSLEIIYTFNKKINDEENEFKIVWQRYADGGPITGLNSYNRIILKNETLNTEVKVFKIDMGEYSGVWSKDKFNTNPHNNKQQIVEMLDLTEKAEVAEEAASKDDKTKVMEMSKKASNAFEQKMDMGTPRTKYLKELVKEHVNEHGGKKSKRKKQNKRKSKRKKPKKRRPTKRSASAASPPLPAGPRTTSATGPSATRRNACRLPTPASKPTASPRSGTANSVSPPSLTWSTFLRSSPAWASRSRARSQPALAPTGSSLSNQRRPPRPPSWSPRSGHSCSH